MALFFHLQPGVFLPAFGFGLTRWVSFNPSIRLFAPEEASDSEWRLWESSLGKL
jgi:hypothetical protein